MKNAQLKRTIKMGFPPNDKAVTIEEAVRVLMANLKRRPPK